MCKTQEPAHASVYPYFNCRRCGAKTRQGTPCQSPAVKGKKRCRMHGGANGSGAQKGNSNARKHGWYSSESLRLRRTVRATLKSAKELLNSLS